MVMCGSEGAIEAGGAASAPRTHARMSTAVGQQPTNVADVIVVPPNIAVESFSGAAAKLHLFGRFPVKGPTRQRSGELRRRSRAYQASPILDPDSGSAIRG